MQLVDVIGRQNTGDFVLAKDLVITKEGHVKTLDGLYVWGVENGGPSIHRPLDDGHALCDLFGKLQRNLSKGHFLKCVLLAGMFDKDMLSKINNLDNNSFRF